MTTPAEDPTKSGSRPADGESVNVRRATTSDRPAVDMLLQASSLPPADLAATGAVFFVAERDGRIVGSVGLETYADAGLLRSLAINEGYRGAGIGRMLVGRAMGVAAAQALDSVYLLTTTAEAYFKRFGFEPIPRDAVQGMVRRSSEFATLCPASAVAMRLVIAEG